MNSEQIRKYCWYFVGIIGVVFFWTGVWDGVGSLPFLENPLISLVVGMVMLSISGFITTETDQLKKAEQALHHLLHRVKSHPHKEEFSIRYVDKVRKKHLLIRADSLWDIEKGFLVHHQGARELFIPLHRVTGVLHKGKMIHGEAKI